MLFYDLRKNYPLKNITTMKVGGNAKYLYIAKSKEDLVAKIQWAKENKIRWQAIGSGSNLIPNDNGFDGLIVINEIVKFRRDDDKVHVGAGNNLLKFIKTINLHGLSGMEKMAGIPGSIGGAIYGCAGAYGQEIKDCLDNVEIFDGEEIFQITRGQCDFQYRSSIFKKNHKWVILNAEFIFKRDNPDKLAVVSEEIIKLREQKYNPGLLCPGSFFKNILISDIKPESLKRQFLSKIPADKIAHGKIPAGYLLEMIGAKGMRFGDIKVAEHHANLIYNCGEGKSGEVAELSKILKKKVKQRYGIDLEEEVQFL